ncbi:MAG: acetylglutamate kinase [Myxococcales bacterium]|nr:acetylglutamate kinase [Polyangiaceae bacterium]MDW8248135.1 acetylglutamate kinase [Myxococcales bacterium]
MRDIIEKANILHKALPYIRRFHGQTFVIKYGGHAMIEPTLRDSFARDITLLKFVGLNPVVVHGGGPQIDDMLGAMGVQSERIDGLRVTDHRTMEVVEMVLGGKLNQEIVSLICKHGGRAVGLTGKDDSFLRGRKVAQMKTKKGKLVDPGRVGEVTDIEGVQDDQGRLIPSLTTATAHRLREEEVPSGGMIPKVACALEAVAGGVRKAHIIDGRTEHAVLLEIFTDQGIGTEFTPNKFGVASCDVKGDKHPLTL